MRENSAISPLGHFAAVPSPATSKGHRSNIHRLSRPNPPRSPTPPPLEMHRSLRPWPATLFSTADFVSPSSKEERKREGAQKKVKLVELHRCPAAREPAPNPSSDFDSAFSSSFSSFGEIDAFMPPKERQILGHIIGGRSVGSGLLEVDSVVPNPAVNNIGVRPEQHRLDADREQCPSDTESKERHFFLCWSYPYQRDENRGGGGFGGHRGFPYGRGGRSGRGCGGGGLYKNGVDVSNHDEGVLSDVAFCGSLEKSQNLAASLASLAALLTSEMEAAKSMFPFMQESCATLFEESQRLRVGMERRVHLVEDVLVRPPLAALLPTRSRLAARATIGHPLWAAGFGLGSRVLN